MNIIGRIKIWFLISGITLIAGIVALLTYRLEPAIDFAGGSLLELSLEKSLPKEEIKILFEANGFENVTITESGLDSNPEQGRVLIKSKPVEQEKKNRVIEELRKKLKPGESDLENRGVIENRFSTIGPTVSSDLIKKAVISVVLASLAIIGYIAFAFRKLPNRQLSWRFGISAVIALLHDLLFTIGVFAIFGHFLGWEVDSLFITALLTVMGFSVHDTIVVFDRIRENMQRHQDREFPEVVNDSLVQTLARSLNTSLTILITLAALLLMGGKTLQPFVFTLFFGIFVGTYSSIFIASPFVVIWQNFINKKSAK